MVSREGGSLGLNQNYLSFYWSLERAIRTFNLYRLSLWLMNNLCSGKGKQDVPMDHSEFPFLSSVYPDERYRKYSFIPGFRKDECIICF